MIRLVAWTLRVTVVVLLVLAAPLGGFEASAQETPGQATGTIAGRVIDSGSLEPLPGARVTLDGTTFVAATDRAGEFRIPQVAPGRHRLVVSYLGYRAGGQEVPVAAGETVTVRIEMRIAFAENVDVDAEGSVIEAQARALNQQRTAANITNVVSADQIGRFPDPNAAEATQRIPGVTIQRDQGEGRYVQIRGTDPRLNSMTINGERIPSPEGDVRQVALDVIPADLLQAIEVSKALTPDMDADAIGGAVNLVLKAAPAGRRLQASLAGGFNDHANSFGQLNGGLTASQRFADGKLGLLVSANGSDVNRGSENFEVVYDEGDLDELQVRHYRIERKRYGVNVAADYKASENTLFNLSGVYNYYSDQEFRRRLRNRVADDRIARDLKDRFVSQTIGNVSLGARHFLGGKELDYKLTWSRADEDRPDEQNSSFVQRRVEFDPNVSPTTIDPDNIQANPQNESLSAFVLEDVELASNVTADRDLVGAVNLRLPLAARPGFTGSIKIGGKYRDKRKSRDNTVSDLDVESIRLDSVLGFQPPSVLDGRYTPGAFPDPGRLRALPAGWDAELNHEEEAGDYAAKEAVAAGYGMADLYFGSRLRLLAGARYERTSLDYTGYEVLFDEEGDFASINPLNQTNSYGQFLPMAHLRFGIDERTNLRAAVTRTLSRPNYYDLAPYNLIITEDSEILRGNPDLLPTTAWNVDLMAERYFQSVGVASVGVFYKRLSNYIFPFQFDELRNGEEFRVIQSQNGEQASVRGVETALQRQLRFLPSPLDGLGVYLNYTFTDSEATFPERSAASTLPGQARHVGNVSLSYEKGGFIGRASVNFHGSYVDIVVGDQVDSAGNRINQDRFYDSHRQIDLTASQAVTPRIRLFVEALNLTNEPLRYYVGTPDRPDQEEYYSWWATFGVKLNF